MNEIENTNLLEIEGQNTRSKRWMRRGGWIAFTLMCLLFFTFLKLPDDRIKATLDHSIAAALSDQGITYSSGETQLSFFFGISYTIKDITLTFPPPVPQAHIDQIRISPSLFPLLIGRGGGTITLKNEKGSLEAQFSSNAALTVILGSTSNSSSISAGSPGNTSVKNLPISLSFKAYQIDLGKLGLLPALTNIQGSALADGSGSLFGDLNSPNTLTGNLKLNLKQFIVASQSIMGFSIPRIEISECMIDFAIDKAKASIKTFRLGKASSAAANAEDEIQGNITGDLTLGKQWDTSTFNLKAKFSLSESIMKSFGLLDAILGAGKQSDGSYAYTLTGPATYPVGAPGPAQGRNFY